tara:strand:+ start:310 stop:1227 length:918 start_codon:yes stop_codon:yes gene_type:complete
MNKIILFWTNPPKNKTYEEWSKSRLEFSHNHELVFNAHKKLGNQVELWTYQKTELPYDNIKLMDANEIFSRTKAYESLKSGHVVAILSDAIRMLQAAQERGTILDMDAVVLKPFPDYESWFATAPAKQTGGFALKWGENNPPFKVNDWDGKALPAFPIKIGKHNSQEFINLARSTFDKLLKPAGIFNKDGKTLKTDKTFQILQTAKKIANKDTNNKIFAPLYMCPFPWWLPAGKCYSLEQPTRLTGVTSLFGYKLPSITDIFKNSYVIQHFFESSFKSDILKTADFFRHLPKECLLAKEYNFIME